VLAREHQIPGLYDQSLVANPMMVPVRRRTILTTALLILWLMVEPALAQQERILIAGIGRMSCTYWLSQSVNEGEGWILGFWSGLNYANTRAVGQHTDGERMIAEVRKVCATRPSMTLAGATVTVYSEMASTQVGQSVGAPVMPEDSKVDPLREPNH
jgi:hypothetical protein